MLKLLSIADFNSHLHHNSFLSTTPERINGDVGVMASGSSPIESIAPAHLSSCSPPAAAAMSSALSLRPSTSEMLRSDRLYNG